MSHPSFQGPPPISLLRGINESVNCVSFTSGDSLIAGSINGNLRLLSLNSGKVILCGRSHESSVLSLIDLGNKMCSSSRDGKLKVWDLEREQFNQPMQTLDTGSMGFCNSSSDRKDPTSNIVVTPSFNDGESLLWDLRTSAIASKYNVDVSCGMITSLLLCSQSNNRGYESICDDSSTQQFVCMGSDDGSVSIFDVRVNR